MRVLIVTGSYPPDRCGVGDYVARLHQQLAADPRVDVAVLTTVQGGAVPAVAQPNVLRVMQDWGLGRAKQFIRALNEFSPDIVHIQYPTQGYGDGRLPWLVPWYVRWSGRRVVQTWHEPYSRSSAVRLVIQATVRGGLIVVRPDYRQLLHRSLQWVFLGKCMRYIRSASTLPACTLDDAELRALRARLLRGQQRLIVFFGFVYPHKRVEFLFDIADPATDCIVIAGEVDANDSYGAHIRTLAASPRWNGKASLLGYLPGTDVTALLAAADAVVLPFQLGGGDWNTSIHAATHEQAFVLTTSRTSAGFDPAQNVYFAQPDDVDEMKAALAKHGRFRGDRSKRGADDAWRAIAQQHIELYGELMANGRRV